MSDESEKMRLALRNVLALAMRMRSKGEREWSGHLIRFCAEGGVKPEVMRTSDEGGEG